MMNPFLTNLFNEIGIDIEHLKNTYLNAGELAYINGHLSSLNAFKQHFYTNAHGNNLEILLFFLNVHKSLILAHLQGRKKPNLLTELYTSTTISGDYDCFRFDLSKFQQTYVPRHSELILYRIGRVGEQSDNLGCSWSTSIEGLNTYCDQSALSKSNLANRPIFVMTVDDSQVLFEGSKSEHEMVLKPKFKYMKINVVDIETRSLIAR